MYRQYCDICNRDITRDNKSNIYSLSMKIPEEYSLGQFGVKDSVICSSCANAIKQCISNIPVFKIKVTNE